MRPIRINQGRIFSWYIRLGSLLLTMFLMAVIFQYTPEWLAIPLAIVICMIVPTVWTAFEILEIDHKRKVITEYSSILGRKVNLREYMYDSLEKVFMNKVKMAQRATSYGGHVGTFTSFEYHAFLKTSSGKKYFLLSRENPDWLKEKIVPLAKKLEVPFQENQGQ
ncbi:MAG: hypothetical protein ABJN36_20490 [Cyclobacteriaceae bacterium]